MQRNRRKRVGLLGTLAMAAAALVGLSGSLSAPAQAGCGDGCESNFGRPETCMYLIRSSDCIMLFGICIDSLQCGIWSSGGRFQRGGLREL